MRKLFKPAAGALLLALLLSGSAGAARTEFLIPGGETIGLKLELGGVSVVDFAESSPTAKNAGLKKGDLICKIDGVQVTSSEQLAQRVAQSQGRELAVTVRRGETEKTLRFAPQRTENGWRLGVYVRDGINGIGTVTYYEPASGAFGALGHGVGDADAFPTHGSAFAAQIVSVSKGKPGEPGALQGAAAPQAVGRIDRNSERGVFGTITLPEKQAVPVARESDVRTGEASIYSCVSGQLPQEYAVRIVEIDLREAHCRNFLIEVTDPALLARTGGIVQGMSGSPIMQNGKLVGAVTHVLVNDPTRGYGIFIENMLAAAQEQQKAA